MLFLSWWRIRNLSRASTVLVTVGEREVNTQEAIRLGSVPFLADKPGPLEVWTGDVGHQATRYPHYRITGGNVLNPRVALQYTLSGCGRLRCGSCTYELTPGTMMLVTFPGEFAYDTPPGGEWEFLYLSLVGAAAVRLGRLAEAQCGPVLTLEPSDPVLRQFRALVQPVLAGSLPDAWDNSGLAYLLLMHLLRRGGNQPSGKRDPDEPMRRAAEYARQHLAEDLDVDLLARHANCSRYHFSRLFKNFTGYPPGEFILRERLQRALELLHSSQLSAREISALCGFHDPVHFGKLFRRRIGVTPLEYRRKNCIG